MATAIPVSQLNTNSSLSNTNGTITPSQASSIVGNRLNFNRAAAERKTVHVMNMNKDSSKKDKNSTFGILSNLSSNHQNYSAISSGLNSQTSSTLDSHSITRASNNSSQYSSHTAGGSFLQRLSSKFTRR
jgi:hypothetical protein